MRVLHRLTALLGIGMLIFSGQPVFAQFPPPPNQGTPPSFLEQMPSMPLRAQTVPYSTNGLPPYPPGAPFPPSSFTASLTDPEYTGYPSSIPPSPPMPAPNVYGPTINPYPTISPFDFSFSNTFNFGGLWNRKEE